VVDRAGVAVAAHQLVGRLNGAVAGGGGGQGGRVEEVDRDGAAPDGLVDGAVGGLVFRLEEAFDLVVGLVEGAGPPGLLLRLAAEAQGGFGEALLALGGRGGAHVDGSSPENEGMETDPR